MASARLKLVRWIDIPSGWRGKRSRLTRCVYRVIGDVVYVNGTAYITATRVGGSGAVTALPARESAYMIDVPPREKADDVRS